MLLRRRAKQYCYELNVVAYSESGEPTILGVAISGACKGISKKAVVTRQVEREVPYSERRGSNPLYNSMKQTKIEYVPVTL